MIYTALTNKAMKVAYDAHNGQLDKCGVPYVFHPFHLAEQMKDEYTTCAALLHDVVEDTSVTFEELDGLFPEEVMTAVRLLTHDEGTDYFDYVRAIKPNAIARAVKLADLRHNSDITRWESVGVTRDEVANRLDKYKKAQQILNQD